MKYLLIIISTLSLTACFDIERVDTTDVKKEMASRKITRVKKGDLIMDAEQQAKAYIASNNYDSLNAFEGINIKVHDSSTISTGSALETQLFEAYKEGIKAGVNPGVNIQYIDDTAEYLITDITNDSTGLKMYSVLLHEKVIVLD